MSTIIAVMKGFEILRSVVIGGAQTNCVNEVSCLTDVNTHVDVSHSIFFWISKK